MIAVDLRNHQRNVGLHAQGAGVGDDRTAGVGKLRLQFAGDGGIQSGENNLRARLRAWRERSVIFAIVGRDGGFQTPARSFGISSAFRTVGRRQPRHFKPRVMLEHLDKSLPDDARGTENSYRKFGRHILRNKVSFDFIPAKFPPGMTLPVRTRIPCASQPSKPWVRPSVPVQLVSSGVRFFQE